MGAKQTTNRRSSNCTSTYTPEQWRFLFATSKSPSARPSVARRGYSFDLYPGSHRGPAVWVTDMGHAPLRVCSWLFDLNFQLDEKIVGGADRGSAARKLRHPPTLYIALFGALTPGFLYQSELPLFYTHLMSRRICSDAHFLPSYTFFAISPFLTHLIKPFHNVQFVNSTVLIPRASSRLLPTEAIWKNDRSLLGKETVFVSFS